MKSLLTESETTKFFYRTSTTSGKKTILIDIRNKTVTQATKNDVYCWQNCNSMSLNLYGIFLDIWKQKNRNQKASHSNEIKKNMVTIFIQSLIVLLKENFETQRVKLLILQNHKIWTPTKTYRKNNLINIGQIHTYRCLKLCITAWQILSFR